MTITDSSYTYVVVSALAGALGGLSGGIAKWAGLCSHIVGKAALYLSVGICNAGMMTLYTKSLAQLSSVLVTSVSTASNVLVTGAISQLYFNGTLKWTWWVGVLLTMSGTLCLTLASIPPSSTLPRSLTRAKQGGKGQKEL